MILLAAALLGPFLALGAFAAWNYFNRRPPLRGA